MWIKRRELRASCHPEANAAAGRRTAELWRCDSCSFTVGALNEIKQGHAFIVRRELVSLADDAALTGSQALDLQALHQGRLALDPEQARAAALQTLASEPGLRGQASANTADVQVEVQRRVPTILLRLVGVSTLTVGAHATAAPREP